MEFIRKLQFAPKAESLITDEIWSNWRVGLTKSGAAHKRVHTAALASGLSWPSSKSDVTFDVYLEMPLNRVKSDLGWDAKRTLILCLAIEYEAFLQETDNNSQLEPQTIKPSENIKDDESSANGYEDSVGNLKPVSTNILEILKELLSSNMRTNLLITNLIKSCEVSGAAETRKIDELKTLLEQVTNLSRNQIIEIEELKKENYRLTLDVERYKSEVVEIATGVQRVGGVQRSLADPKVSCLGNVKTSFSCRGGDLLSTRRYSDASNNRNTLCDQPHSDDDVKI